MPGIPTNPKFDNPAITPTEFAGGTPAPDRRTAQARRALVGQGKSLIDRLLAGYKAGRLTAADVAVLQALLGWVTGRGPEEAGLAR